jgi:GGDEF domain-containing protein
MEPAGKCIPPVGSAAVPGECFVRLGMSDDFLSLLPSIENAAAPFVPRAVLVAGELDAGSTAEKIRRIFGETVPFVVLCESDRACEWLACGASAFVPRSAGSATVLASLEAVAALSERATGLNPLSGLPGTAAIAARLESDVLHGPCTAAYIDITGFKPFNDYYGFARGDAVLRSLTAILSEHMRGWFLGHIGGDDFLCTGQGDEFRRAVMKAARVFAGRATGFYNSADRARGGIEALDRGGLFRFYPFMELTVSFVTGEGCGSIGKLAAMAGVEKKRVRGEELPATVSGLVRPGGGDPSLHDLMEWEARCGRDVLTFKAVIESAGVLGDRSMTGCLALLLREHPDEHIRKSAARALGMLSGPEASEAVVTALRDASRHVRAAAAAALPYVLGAESGRMLAVATGDPCTWVRRAALRGLGLSGWSGAAEIIAKALASGGAPGRFPLDRRKELEAALEGVSFLGDRSLSGAILPFVGGSGGVNPDLAWRCLITLGGEACLITMLESLGHGRPPRFLRWLDRFPMEDAPPGLLTRLEEALAERLPAASDEDAARVAAFLARLPSSLSDPVRSALRGMLQRKGLSTEHALSVLVQRGVPASGDEVGRLVIDADSGSGAPGRRGIILLLQWASTGDYRISRPFLEKLLRHESREIRTAAARTVLRLARNQ